jgi:hypothetical protein
MFFSRYPGHGLEPVGEMGSALFKGPFLHGMGDNIGGFDVEDGAFMVGVDDFLVRIHGKLDLHDLNVEGVLAVIFRYGNTLPFFGYVAPFRCDNWACLFHNSSK